MCVYILLYMATAVTLDNEKNTGSGSLDIQKQIHNHFLSNDHLKKTKANIIKACFNDVLSKLCFSIDADNILLDYRYFKFIACAENYELLISYIVSVIKNILKTQETFVFHVNLDTLTLLHVEKYFGFIKKISEVLKVTFPDKLSTCYIYNAPFIFSKIISILSAVVDKKTQQKIKLVNT